jgi:hypothetical protein
MNLLFRSLFTLAAIGLLAACGSGSSSPAEPLTANAQITAGTAPAIAAAVLDTALNSDDLQDLSDVTSLLGGVTAPAVADPNKAQVTVTEENIPCPVDGTYEITYDIADPLTPALSPGDSVSASFFDCDDGAEVLSGGFGLTINQLTGDLLSNSFLFGFSMNLVNFTIIDQSMSSLHGSIDYLLDTQTPLVTVIMFSGSAMDMVDGNVTTSLNDFSSTVTIDDAQAIVSIVASGFVMSSEFEGIAGFNVETPIQYFNGDQYPSSGVLLVTGNDGVVLRITAVNNTNVVLDIDIDGNGVYDSTINTTWAELNL